MTDLPAWLPPALAYVREWLGYQMRATEQPGCAIAVVWRGRVVLDEAFGHANLAAGEALTPRHRHRVASHSKTFTAAAMMKLREQARVSLEDAAGKYVAGLHPDVATATVGQLLSHTAGVMRDGPDCAYWVGRAPFLDESSLRADLAMAPAIEAGVRLKYSNHGFGLAGLVIEAITGEPYAVWVKREIVDAAGLTETTPDVPLPAAAMLARGHSGKALLGRRLVFAGDQSTGALASATGFVSTASDIAKFLGQLAPNAPASILTVASRREMSRPQWKDRWGAVDQSYGLGTISWSFDGWEGFGHSGGFQGYITRSAVIPEQDLAVSCLTNAVDGLSHGWLDGAMAILKRFQTGGAPAPGLKDWTGRWWSVWGPTDLVPVGDRVVLASPGLLNPLTKMPELTATGADEATISYAGGFGSYGEPAGLIRDATGAVVQVQIAGGRLVAERELAAELEGRYEG